MENVILSSCCAGLENIGKYHSKSMKLFYNGQNRGMQTKAYIHVYIHKSFIYAYKQTCIWQHMAISHVPCDYSKPCCPCRLFAGGTMLLCERKLQKCKVCYAK